MNKKNNAKVILLVLLCNFLWGSLFPCVKIGYEAFHIDGSNVFYDWQAAKTGALMDVEKYIDVARVAPSSANTQPLKYVVVQTASMVEKVFPLLKWAGYLPGYTPKEGERPVAYIIVCVDKNNGMMFNNRRQSRDSAVVEKMREILTLGSLFDGIGGFPLSAKERRRTLLTAV